VNSPAEYNQIMKKCYWPAFEPHLPNLSRRGDWDLLAVTRTFWSASGHAASVPQSAPSLTAAATG
jgi:hypothetical protein